MSHEHLLLRRRWGERALIYTCVGVCFGALFGCGGIAGIYITRKIPNRWLMYLVALGIVWSIFLMFVPVPFWLYWSILSLPTCGIASLTFRFLLWLNDLYLYQVTWDNSLRIRERWHEKRQEGRVQNKLSKHPTQDNRIQMGMMVTHDVRRRVPDSFHIHQNYLWADELFLNQHILLIGAPGSGKTQAIKHIISEILSKTNRDVFIVDGKDERLSAPDFTQENSQYAEFDSADLAFWNVETPIESPAIRHEFVLTVVKRAVVQVIAMRGNPAPIPVHYNPTRETVRGSDGDKTVYQLRLF